MVSFSFPSRKRVPQFLCCCLVFFCLQARTQTANVQVIDNDFPETELSRNSVVLMNLMRQVDSVSHTPGVARHFAKLYTSSMSNIAVQLQKLDTGAQAFVKKFEITFINYFLEACDEFNNGRLEPGSIWHFYFSHPEAEPWQLTLIGVNAHINGDIWKGLVKNFSEDEIRRYKKNLLNFQSSIAKAFQPFFEELLEESAYLRFMDNFTKGAARRYGEWLIYNWRLRQINLAMTYFNDPPKFKEKFAVVDRKKNKIDRLILRNKKLPML